MKEAEAQTGSGSVPRKFCTGERRVFLRDVVLSVREKATEARRFMGPGKRFGCVKERGMGRYLLLKRGLRRRDFRLSESCATPAFRNPIMKPDDASRGVHYHQFFYRINPDKTVDSICAFCYMTAATANSQAEIHELERKHRCPE